MESDDPIINYVAPLLTLTPNIDFDARISKILVPYFNHHTFLRWDNMRPYTKFMRIVPILWSMADAISSLGSWYVGV